MPEVVFEGTPHPLPGAGTIEAIKEALNLIPKMSEGQIISTAIYASGLEIQAFLLRGACAAELRKRFAARLAGGRGRRDEAGVGRQARMREVAEKVGINLKTLRTDMRIYQTFFEPAPENIRTLACERSLPREYFVTALAAPDPIFAIEIAITKRRDPNFTRQQYREEVRTLQRETGVKKVMKPTTDSHWLRVKISPEAFQALSELNQEAGSEQGEIVTAALLAFHRQYKREPAQKAKQSRLLRDETKHLPGVPKQVHLDYGEEEL